MAVNAAAGRCPAGPPGVARPDRRALPGRTAGDGRPHRFEKKVIPT